MRVIRYTLNDPQRVGHGQEHVLLTTLLDAERYPAMELVLLYHERWEIELVYDEQKTHQNPWRVTKSADLRSQTPLGVIAGIVRPVAGSLRGAFGDDCGGSDGRTGPGSVVVRGLPANSALSAAGVPRAGHGGVRGVV